MSHITANDPIFARYLEHRAAHSHEELGETASKVKRDEFYDRVYSLHEQFMAGEFSLGYMAQQLNVSKPDLYHLLDAMGLKVTNV